MTHGQPRTPEPVRCPRCEGYEATYHTFEGECSLRDPDLEAGLSASIEEFLLVEAALCSCPDGICVCDERSE